MIIQRRMNILVVEDNPADAHLVKTLLEETGYPSTITMAIDGEVAIRIIEGAAIGERPAPDLVLLDINLPKKNGHEVLCSIRGNDRFENTFVAMCSGSTSYEDIAKARSNGADAYLFKPMGLEEMGEIIDRLRNIMVSLNDRSDIAVFC